MKRVEINFKEIAEVYNRLVEAIEAGIPPEKGPERARYMLTAKIAVSALMEGEYKGMDPQLVAQALEGAASFRAWGGLDIKPEAQA